MSRATASRWPARAWQYTLALKGQRTPDHTLSIDQIAIGNRSTVRGFDGDSVLLAENGWYGRNELSTPVPFGSAQGALYVGLDYGQVRGPSDILLLGHGLGGAVVGWRGKFKALQCDLAIAAPLSMPEGFKTAGSTLYASGTYAF